MCEPVVNFSELSNDKKQEFVNFLLNNNIKFQEGSNNYIAKVTLKDSKLGQKENRMPRSPTRKSTGKSISVRRPISNQKTQKPLQILPHNNHKEKHPVDSEQASSPTKVKKKKLKQGHGRHSTITLYQTPTSQRGSFPPPSPDQSRNRNRSKSANTRQTSSSLAVEQQVKISRQSQYKSSSKVKMDNILQAMTAQNNLQESTVIAAARQAQGHHNAASYKPLPRQSLNYPNQKLHELLNTLKLPSVPGRPTRLPRIQVLKTIEEVYNGNFTKNTILLKSRKFREAYERGNCVFSAYVIEHFEQKYKTARQYQGHMLNLVHSLLCYIHEAHPPSSLTMFYRFLMEEYEYQDLVFFLFARSIFEREFGKTMEKLIIHNPARMYQESTLTKKQVTRFIKAILGKDSQEIVSEFQQMIFLQMGESIPLYDLFTILLVDYQFKRKSKIRINNCHLSNTDTNTTVSPANKNSFTNNLQTQEEVYRGSRRKQLIREASSNINKTTSKCSMFHEGSSSNFEQLTFGDCSVSNRIEEEDETEFWNDFESLRVVDVDPLFEQLEQKLKKKVCELVEIMLGGDESIWNGPAKQLSKLILHKSLRMLDAIISMDKIKWFRLLRVQKPTQQHLEVVEILQLMLRNIRRLNKSDQHQQCLEMRHLQSEFCKALLTVEQLKKAIEKIVIG